MASHVFEVLFVIGFQCIKLSIHTRCCFVSNCLSNLIVYMVYKHYFKHYLFSKISRVILLL